MGKMTRILAMAVLLAAAGLWGTAPDARASVFDSLGGGNPLIKAIEDKDREKFMLELVKQTRPTIRNTQGVPALVLAVETRDAFFVQELLKRGARPDDRSRPDDRTALSRAAELGNVAMVRALLTSGADPDMPGEQNEPPLLKAANLGHAAVVRLLIEHDADLTATEMTGRTAMEVAERNGHRDIVAILRDAGAEY